MSVIWIAVLLVGGIGVVAAVLLWLAAKKFHVEVDPRIGEIEAILPGANCGGCGLRGCADFARACVGASTLENLNCPGSSPSTMAKIASIVGLEPSHAVPKVAVVRCQGTCACRPSVVAYDGIKSCAIENSQFGGDTACAYGCLGCGDCDAACPYGAIEMDYGTRLPRVDWDKCVGCGKCVAACPRGITTLVPAFNAQNPRLWVACVNHDKGSLALKECDAACIGCGKCLKACPSNAVHVTRFAAEIDQNACTGCGECFEVCPRFSIVAGAKNRRQTNTSLQK